MPDDILKLAAELGPVVFIFSVGVIVAGVTITTLVRMHYKEREINNDNHRKERDMWKDDIKDILDRHREERSEWQEEARKQADRVSDRLTEIAIDINRKRSG